MEFQTILYEVKEQIATIALNLPEVRNPLTEKLVTELIQAIKLADSDEQVHAMILTGRGKSFSAGGNLNEFKRTSEKDVPTLYFEGKSSTELFKLGATVQTPMIAAVNGAALGGGTGLVAMCHVAIASTSAKLGLTELKLGIVPFVILPWVRRAVGNRKVMEMMLKAEVLTAEDACKYNLVHQVVEPERLDEEVWNTAKIIAAHSPLAVKLALDSYFTTEQMDFMKSFDYLSNLRLVSFKSEDLKEGASAFLEKRVPDWKGV
ncbi:enoyl-CoA hydratase/isomerase family protein [Cytobacillus sp. Hm23]